MADTPFNMSFEDLVAQVEANGASPMNGTPAVSAPVPNTTVAEQNTIAQPADSQPAAPTTGLSFEDMVAQAQANAGINQESSNSTSAENAVNQESNNSTSAASTSQPAGGLSFDEMVAQAQANAAKTEEVKTPSETEQVMTPPEETPAENTASDTAAEETPAENTSAEEKPAEDVPTEANTQADEATAEESNTVEETKPAAKTKGRSKKKSKAKEPVETPPVPEDNTSDYAVDLTGKATQAIVETATVESDASSMETLFTPDEVAALRKDIRSFVRKEIKMAMVDAMKELANEFK